MSRNHRIQIRVLLVGIGMFIIVAILAMVKDNFALAGICSTGVMAAWGFVWNVGQDDRLEQLSDELNKLRNASTDAPEGTWPHSPSQ